MPAFPELGNPIDRFLETARRDRALIAAPQANRRTLVRRAYLDLLGLPPTLEETSEFLSDTERGRLGAVDRSAARLSALRRALGPALARRGAVRRLDRLRAGLQPHPARGITVTT